MMGSKPDDAWLLPEALAGLAELGQGDFAKVADDLRVLLAFPDFREEIAGLVLLAVRDPSQLSEAIDGLVTQTHFWATDASARLDMSQLVALLLVGQGIKRALRAASN